VQVAIVVGGGNFFRGAELQQAGIDRSRGDYMGMLGTVMNCLALQDFLEQEGQATRVQTAITMGQVAEPYIPLKAIRHLEKGRVVIFGAGAGMPYFSTDTVSIQRSLEIHCDEVLMGKNGVDGVYTADPRKDENAKRFATLSYNRALVDNLAVMDAASYRHRRTQWLERDAGFLHERNRRTGIVEKHKEEKKKLGLSTKIFIALLTGAVCGVLIHYYMPEGYFRDTILINGILYVLGNGFIRLMQMLVVPLVFCSLVCGAMAIGDTKTLGTVGVKTILFYLCTTALAICVALGIASLINPGVGLNIALPEDATEVATTQVDFAETLLNIIPKNIFTSLSAGDMLPIIFFALFVGILLAAMGNRVSTVANFFSQFNDIMMEMTIAVMKAAPVGVFCLIAKTFAGIGFDAFVPMLKYMGSVILALAVQCFVVYQVMLFAFTRLNPFKFIKKFFPVMTFAFSTSTSNATIPLSIDTLYKKIGVSKQISSFTIPLGATINMDGTSIMQGVAVVFIAQAYGIPLTPAAIATVIATATIASIGTAGVPSVGLVTLSMVLTSDR